MSISGAYFLKISTTPPSEIIAPSTFISFSLFACFFISSYSVLVNLDVFNSLVVKFRWDDFVFSKLSSVLNFNY